MLVIGKYLLQRCGIGNRFTRSFDSTRSYAMDYICMDTLFSAHRGSPVQCDSIVTMTTNDMIQRRGHDSSNDTTDVRTLASSSVGM